MIGGRNFTGNFVIILSTLDPIVLIGEKTGLWLEQRQCALRKVTKLYWWELNAGAYLHSQCKVELSKIMSLFICCTFSVCQPFFYFCTCDRAQYFESWIFSPISGLLSGCFDSHLANYILLFLLGFICHINSSINSYLNKKWCNISFRRMTSSLSDTTRQSSMYDNKHLY